MTTTDLKAILEQAIVERNNERGKGGAVKVARMLGVSESHLSQYRKGTYPNPEPIMRRIREVLGSETVPCPELGKITLAECSAHKKRQPMTDSFYARMYRACQQCERRH